MAVTWETQPGEVADIVVNPICRDGQRSTRLALLRQIRRQAAGQSAGKTTLFLKELGRQETRHREGLDDALIRAREERTWW